MPRPGRVPAPALTSPRKEAHRIVVMNQRSLLPAPPLCREAATNSGSFSAGASAWRSHRPAAGGWAPLSSSSDSSSAAREKLTRCCLASRRGLGNSWRLRTGRPSWHHLPVGGRLSGLGGRTLEAAGAAGCRLQAAGNALLTPPFTRDAANRKLTWLPRRPDVAEPTRARGLAPRGGASWSCSLGPHEALGRTGGSAVRKYRPRVLCQAFASASPASRGQREPEGLAFKQLSKIPRAFEICPLLICDLSVT